LRGVYRALKNGATAHKPAGNDKPAGNEMTVQFEWVTLCVSKTLFAFLSVDRSG
jgi:hypothetical protein